MKRPPCGSLFALSLSQLNDTAKGLYGANYKLNGQPMDSPALLSPCPANLNTQLLTHRIKTRVAHVFTAELATEYIANSALIVKNEVYRACIWVKVMNFVANANQLAAAFVFPPLPAHAQLAVFNSPLPRITAAAVVTVFGHTSCRCL